MAVARVWLLPYLISSALCVQTYPATHERMVPKQLQRKRIILQTYLMVDLGTYARNCCCLYLAVVLTAGLE